MSDKYISIEMGKINKKITRQLVKKKRVNAFHCEIMTSSNEMNEASEDRVQMEDSSIDQGNSGEAQVETEEVKVEAMGKSKQNVKKGMPKVNKFYQRCAKERQNKGLIILPEKVESKIYRLKKALRKKGVDPNEIKETIRRKRREEEIKLRKDLKTLCYKCRQSGHSLANCPFEDKDEASGDLCYYCGSTEHRLSACSKFKKGKHLPYAKCFICHKTGHLTRDCPQNQKGVFPKGGKCRLCGSVNHLSKDCEKNEKQVEQPEISLRTYNDVQYGVDTDDIVFKPQKTMSSKKVVKF